MRFELVFLESVDPWFGRVDRASLPQQALMEMVIDGIANKQKICGDANEPKDSEEWIGVTVEDEEVVSIRWRQFKLEGSLHLEWLPSSVMEFDATDNNLTANPTKGHLSVVGWTSTPVLGEAKNLFKPLVVFLSWRRPY